MFIFEGFIVGLVGSLHCLGMCGPLVLALPVSHSSNTNRFFGGIVYNIGRAITYALMGLFFGIVGKGLQLSGLQQWVSIAFGAIIILGVILPSIINVNSALAKITSGLTGPLKNQMGALLQQQKIYPLFLFGLLNGLLPCGLVYMAIMGAIVSNTLIESSLYMFLFGIGTLPLMFLLIYFSDLIKSKVLIKIRKLIPVFIILLGILFILRGLNLGIPYVSPKLNMQMHETHHMHCH